MIIYFSKTFISLGFHIFRNKHDKKYATAAASDVGVMSGMPDFGT